MTQDFSNTGRREDEAYADWAIQNGDKLAHDEAEYDAMSDLKMGRSDATIVRNLREKWGISEECARETLRDAKDYMMDDAIRPYI